MPFCLQLTQLQSPAEDRANLETQGRGNKGTKEHLDSQLLIWRCLSLPYCNLMGAQRCAFGTSLPRRWAKHWWKWDTPWSFAASNWWSQCWRLIKASSWLLCHWKTSTSASLPTPGSPLYASQPACLQRTFTTDPSQPQQELQRGRTAKAIMQVMLCHARCGIRM